MILRAEFLNHGNFHMAGWEILEVEILADEFWKLKSPHLKVAKVEKHSAMFDLAWIIFNQYTLNNLNPFYILYLLSVSAISIQIVYTVLKRYTKDMLSFFFQSLISAVQIS